MATEDPLPALGRRLATAGGSAAPLARVSRATHDFGRLLLSYEMGHYAGMSVKEWRETVAKLYDDAVARIGAGRRSVEEWERTAPARPQTRRPRRIWA